MTDNVTPIRPGADARVEESDAWFRSLPVSQKAHVLEMAEALARGEKLTPALIDEIGGAIRRGQIPRRLRVNNAPLCEAETHLNIARSSLDVLHDVFATGDGALKESVADCMDGMLYGILEHVRKAEKLLAARFASAGAD